MGMSSIVYENGEGNKNDPQFSYSMPRLNYKTNVGL